MMQAPQLLYALARQRDWIAPQHPAIEHEPEKPASVRRPASVAAPRSSWFWQLLFGRRSTTVS